MKENNGTFSNGDTVKVTVSLEGEYKVKKKLVGGTVTKKVSGLEEVKTVDLFDNFSDIKFDGKNSLGSIDFSEKLHMKTMHLLISALLLPIPQKRTVH